MKKQKKTSASPAQAAKTAFEQAAETAGLTPQAGKEAVEGKYRKSVTSRTAIFTGSVDLDAAFAQSESNAHRWDYGLGLQKPGQAECAVWVEPHSGTVGIRAGSREARALAARGLRLPVSHLEL